MQRTRGKDTVDVQTTQAPDGRIQRIGGLTKREYFSVKCLQGLLAEGESGSVESEDLSETAVDMADCLIDTLNKTQGS